MAAKAKPGRRPIDRRAEILDAAESLYATLGHDKTTVTDIGRELGMSAANLYRHFPNRQAIDDAIARRKLTVIEDAAWAAARTASADPVAAFRRLVIDVTHATVALIFEQDKLYELCRVATEEKWPVVERFVHDLQGVVRHVLIEGRNAGVFRVDDPDRVAGAAFWALARVWHPQMLALYRDDMLEETAHGLADMVLNSLRP